MDLERGFVKALFYDYQPERVIELIREDKDGLWLLDEVPQILKWQLRGFDEADLDEAKEEFIAKCKRDYVAFDDTLWPLMYISELAGKMMVKDGREQKPKVIFNQLLRWRILTRDVGEDLLTLAWLAKEEMNARKERRQFTWEDQIPIQKTAWNQYVGCTAMCDIHAHLGASTDAFSIRWIYWMNNCWRNSKLKPERHLNSIAAIIRFYVFKIVEEGYRVSDQEKVDIMDALTSDTILTLLMDDVYSQEDGASELSMKPNIDGIEHWDYAIQADWKVGESVLQSPYMMLAGERKLMYSFLKLLYKGEPAATEFGVFFYLYLIIKADNRKKFIQTNGLIGLRNYQGFKERGNEDVIDHIGEPKRRYAIQTSLGVGMKNRLETRISWQFKKKEKEDDQKEKEENLLLDVRVAQCLFGKKTYDKKKILERVTLVVTNSKRNFKWENRMKYVRQLKDEFDEIIDRARRNAQLKGKDGALVGIDFSSSDRFARPEVYAPLIRYARKKGYYWFTYHAGEDFYDLMDGLRTIDEILGYLEWDEPCRLGHAFALGVNPYTYYKYRGRNVIATKQVMLDNLVWYLEKKVALNFQLNLVAEREILREIGALYGEIGYDDVFNMDTYQKCMKLREDLKLEGSEAEGQNVFAQCAVDHEDVELEALRQDGAVKKLFEEYRDDADIHERGIEITHWKIPRGVEQGILAIQKELLTKLRDRKIAIETCPSSNYEIGPFQKYEELPLNMFLEKLPDNSISINTDDKGIITTSIENEYALMAVAMHKKGYSKKDIKRKLQRVSKNATRSRFGNG